MSSMYVKLATGRMGWDARFPADVMNQGAIGGRT